METCSLEQLHADKYLWFPLSFLLFSSAWVLQEEGCGPVIQWQWSHEPLKTEPLNQGWFRSPQSGPKICTLPLDSSAREGEKKMGIDINNWLPSDTSAPLEAVSQKNGIIAW